MVVEFLFGDVCALGEEEEDADGTVWILVRRSGERSK